MKTLDLTINYQSNAPEDSLWVRLEQEGLEDDVATLEDTANFIDEAYSIEACAEEPTSEEPTEESISEAVKEVFDYSICKSDYDGSINVRVRVVRSDISFPYTVHIAGGEILSTEIISEEIISEVFIESGTSVVLNYPVISEGNFYWLSDLVSSGDYSINRKGTTLYWSSVSSGTIKTIYATTYDVLNIKVYGVDGEYGKATVRVVYQGNIDDLETEIPESVENDRSLCNESVTIIIKEDRVTCYKAVTANQLCSCSKDIVNTYSYEKIVECPDWVSRCPGTATDCMALIGSETVNEYVECAGDNQVSGTSKIWSVSSPEYYKKTCCEDPGFVLPQCYEKTTSYRGGQPISYGQQFWRDLYGPLTRFVPVSPEGGECGQHITKQVVDAEKDCCDRLPPLVWDDAASPDYIAANSTVWVYVRDGLPPYKWHISSEQGGVWFVESGGSNHESETPFAALVAGDTVCGTHTIEVVDDCGTVVFGAVLAPDGHWERGEVILPRNIAASGYLHLGHGEWVTDGGTQYIELQAGGVKYRQNNGWCIVAGVGPYTDTGVGGCPSERSQYSAWWGTDPLGEDTTYQPLPKIDENFVVSGDCGGCYGYDRYGVLSADWSDLVIFGPYTVVVTGQSDYLVGETVVVGVGGSCRMSQYRKCYGELEIWRWKC